MDRNVVHGWLRSVLGPYANADRTFADVVSVLDSFASLSPRTELYISNVGHSSLLLQLKGTVPISFRNNTYNIPVEIWVPRAYPREPPIGYVTPTRDMLVRKTDAVELDGLIEGVYQKEWTKKWESKSLLAFVQSCQDIFSKQPPVYAKPPAGTESTRPASTSAGTSSQASAASANGHTGSSSNDSSRTSDGQHSRPPPPLPGQGVASPAPASAQLPPGPPQRPPKPADSWQQGPAHHERNYSQPPPVPAPAGPRRSSTAPSDGRAPNGAFHPTQPLTHAAQQQQHHHHHHHHHHRHPHSPLRDSHQHHAHPARSASIDATRWLGQAAPSPHEDLHDSRRQSRESWGGPVPVSRTSLDSGHYQQQQGQQPYHQYRSSQQYVSAPQQPYTAHPPPQQQHQQYMQHAEGHTHPYTHNSQDFAPLRRPTTTQTPPSRSSTAPIPPPLPPPFHRESLDPSASQSMQQQQQAPTPPPPPPPPPPPASTAPQDLLDSLEDASAQGYPLGASPTRTGTIDGALQSAGGSGAPAPAPAPPRPLNPELLALHVALHQKISSRLAALRSDLSASNSQLRLISSDLEAGPPAIADEMARLSAVRDVCRSRADALRTAVQHAQERTAWLNGPNGPGAQLKTHELVLADSIPGAQLLQLVCRDLAITDTLYHLGRALSAERVQLDVYLKWVRVLGREQFLARALASKIARGLEALEGPEGMGR